MKSASFFCAEKRIAGSIGWKPYPLCGMIEPMEGFYEKVVAINGNPRSTVNITGHILIPRQKEKMRYMVKVYFLG